MAERLIIPGLPAPAHHPGLSRWERDCAATIVLRFFAAVNLRLAAAAMNVQYDRARSNRRARKSSQVLGIVRGVNLMIKRIDARDWMRAALLPAIMFCTAMLGAGTCWAEGDAAVVADTAPQSAAWESQTLPTKLTVGYSVRIADVNRDALPDLIVVDAKRILWFENPTWTAHSIHATPDAPYDFVCGAAEDLDGDGDLDLAIGYDWQPNNTHSGGALGWLEAPTDPRQTWTLHPLATPLPTVHRIYWGDPLGTGRRGLLVVPLKGRGASAPGWDDVGVDVSLWQTPAVQSAASDAAAWSQRTLEQSLPVMHNVQVVDWDREGGDELLLASLRGVHLWTFSQAQSKPRLIPLGSGDPTGSAPAQGASEIRLGRLDPQHRYLATIEPWHGNQVVVYLQPDGVSDAAVIAGQGPLWKRQVIDQELQWGHAVACANVDEDPAEELVIGVRDDAGSHRCGVRIYDPQDDGSWKRTLVHPGQVAVEDLATGDLDGDGRVEIIAVGRATGNVVIYRRSAAR